MQLERGFVVLEVMRTIKHVVILKKKADTSKWLYIFIFSPQCLGLYGYPFLL